MEQEVKDERRRRDFFSFFTQDAVDDGAVKVADGEHTCRGYSVPWLPPASQPVASLQHSGRLLALSSRLLALSSPVFPPQRVLLDVTRRDFRMPGGFVLLSERLLTHHGKKLP